MAESLTVAGLGDVHVGESAAHPYRDLFRRIADEADVLALCGDLTNHGKIREAEILAEDIRGIGVPQFVHESVNEAMKLESALRQLETERTVLLLHYAPIAETVEGEPKEIFPFLGSSRLAETIDRYHDRVKAVLHGHAHHGRFTGRTPRGTPVYNCAQTIPKDGERIYALIEV